jgi:hypothetical protein
MGYAYCRTSFHTIIVYSITSVTSTPIYTMEVNSSSERIKKFNRRPSTFSLKEFKATFSTVVCELELKYGAKYTEAFVFKQLAHYVHYKALDVYKQHSPRILGITQIPNPIAITTTSQAALQATIAHHGTMPNNPNLVPILVNISPQQLIAAIVSIPPTIDAPTFVDLVGGLFRVLELKFSVKNSQKNLQLTTFSRQKDETLKMFYKGLLKFKEDILSNIDLEVAHQYLRSQEGTLALHA